MKEQEFEDAYQLYYDYDYIDDNKRISDDYKSYKFKNVKIIE